MNVPLASLEGKRRLDACIGTNHTSSSMRVWRPQSGRTLCAFATLACMVNSIKYDEDEDSGRTDSELFEMAVEMDTLGITRSTVLTEGLTLEEFVKVAVIVSPKCINSIRLNADDDTSSKASWKQTLVRTLQDQSKSRLACNYHMTTAGQSPFGGHFSPLVAYHEVQYDLCYIIIAIMLPTYPQDTDSFLILDVWPDTEPLWIEWETLW